MLSDESPPTARVLSDDVSLARHERRLVSRKRLEIPAPTSSCSTSASSEIFQLREKSYHRFSVYFRRTANQPAKSETYLVGRLCPASARMYCIGRIVFWSAMGDWLVTNL